MARIYNTNPENWTNQLISIITIYKHIYVLKKNTIRIAFLKNNLWGIIFDDGEATTNDKFIFNL